MTVHTLVFTALFVACGLLLPFFFHMAGMGGSVFLPMHLPVLLAGLILGWRPGLLAGMLTPLLSSFLTGMPPLFPVAPMMALELAVYGGVAGYARYNLGKGIFPSLVAAMVCGRLAVMVLLFFFAGSLGIRLSPLAYIAGGLMHGFPGIILQLVLVPLIAARLESVFHRQLSY